LKGYVTWIDQDTSTGTDERSFDILRETEIHFTGESTLDNGLTVGFHAEADLDTDSDNVGNNDFSTEEGYAYFSGAWGRVNFGMENGAAYLLQVAAPSADSNYDGIRQFVSPLNYDLTGLNGNAVVSVYEDDGLDYDNDLSGYQNKITYLTPVLNGFQAGVSFTPDVNSMTNQVPGTDARARNGVHNATDAAGSTYGAAYEVGARYEGSFDQVGVILGGGYTSVQEESTTATIDDFQEWNIGLDLNWGAFGLGGVYTENNNGQQTLDKNKTWVVGLDYTTGPFKLGASYLNNNSDLLGATSEIDTDRWTGGVVYTYGPGMTFRGSISYVNTDLENSTNDVEATDVLLGTQINF